MYSGILFSRLELPLVLRRMLNSRMRLSSRRALSIIIKIILPANLVNPESMTLVGAKRLRRTICAIDEVPEKQGLK